MIQYFLTKVVGLREEEVVTEVPDVILNLKNLKMNMILKVQMPSFIRKKWKKNGIKNLDLL